MIVRPRPHWLRMLFVRRGSLLPRILGQLVFIVTLSTLVVLLHGQVFHWKVTLTSVPFSLMGVALAIFLGFRINASYDRYWEARKQWGALLIGARSLTREVASFAPDEPDLQRRAVRMLAAFVFALKHQLRGTDPRADLACRLDPAVVDRVCAARFVPSALLLCLAQDFAAARRAGSLTDLQLQSMDTNLNLLTEASGACERIANTPIPYTYRVLMNRTVMVYCLLLPVGLANAIGWLTVLVGPFIAYTFLALDVIGEQIEEPFGTSPNDLALDAMSVNIEASVRELLGDRDLPAPLRPVDCVLT